MDDKKLSLDDLIGSVEPAKSSDSLKEEKAKPLNRFRGHKLRKEGIARMVAQEYVRNGFRFGAAYRTVTGSKTTPDNHSMHKLLGPNMDIFMDEVRLMVERSDIDKDKALNLLWAIVNTSVLDYMDDYGRTLSIKELKALPRTMQVMIHEVKVKVTHELIKGEDGKPILDDIGSPYMKRVEQVFIKIPEKMVAINQLALLMRWSGPMVNLNVNINVGQLMIEADERQKRVGRMYDENGKIVGE